MGVFAPSAASSAASVISRNSVSPSDVGAALDSADPSVILGRVAPNASANLSYSSLPLHETKESLFLSTVNNNQKKGNETRSAPSMATGATRLSSTNEMGRIPGI